MTAAVLKGDKELIRKLKELGDKGAKRALRKAERKGAAPIRKAARAEASAHRKTGRFIRSIKTVSRTKKGTVSTTVRAVGGEEGAPHAGFLEFGTKARRTKRGKSTGRMPALGPMTKAYKQEGQNALDIAAAELKVQIEVEATRG